MPADNHPLPRSPFQDPTLSDDDVLVRRLPEAHNAVGAPDPTTKVRTVSKSAWSSSSSRDDQYLGCSVDVLADLKSQALDPYTDAYWKDVPVVLGVRVRDVRAIGSSILVGRDPRPGEPAHASIWHQKNQGEPRALTQGQQKRILAASFVIRPNDGSVQTMPLAP